MFDRFGNRSSKGQCARSAGAHAVPETTRVITESGYRIEIDRAGPMLELASAPWYERDEPIPTLGALRRFRSHFVSASVLAQKAKQFDDGLYAAVELAAQLGAGSFRGKAWLLETILRRLEGMPSGPTAGVLYGAAQLGGLNVVTPPELQASKREAISGFLSNELGSRPISFYTWSEELKRIFQQDRFLQQPLADHQAIGQVVQALKHEETWGSYERWLQLASRLTNRFKGRDLRNWTSESGEAIRESDAGEVRFLPASRSHETDLAKRLYGDTPVPDGFNLAQELIGAVRDGRVSLEPKDDSGWYDLQTWSLEPLLSLKDMPEGGRLRIDDDYGKRLQELFKGSLALTRETHVKLETITFGSAAASRPQSESLTITVRPGLSVEPLYTYYLRRAIGYRFVRDVLEQTFGTSALRSFSRVTPNGPISKPLGEELEEVSGLFYGAAAVVCEELGFTAAEREKMERTDLNRAHIRAEEGQVSLGSGRGTEADRQTFRTWTQDLSGDEDLNQDCRMMVPICFDEGRKKVKVWVFLGWSSEPLKVSFVGQPTVRVFDSSSHPADDKVRVKLDSQYESPAYPVTAEIYVSRLMDRDEFRTHCDHHRTRSAILDSLG